MTTTTEVQMVPVDAITVLNPRARNKRIFQELVTSIAHLGLKKPITVSRRGTEPGYDLVCGQGRLEAFIALGQSEIPAIVIQVPQEDCYVMSLVENLARRHPGSLELMREIGKLKDRGYTTAEIAMKVDFTPDYIAAVCYLLENGEERLVIAVERGVMPANIAMEIARAGDGDVQRALAEAYENKLLPGNQILAVRPLGGIHLDHNLLTARKQIVLGEGVAVGNLIELVAAGDVLHRPVRLGRRESAGCLMRSAEVIAAP